jgi:hypothetical protein
MRDGREYIDMNALGIIIAVIAVALLLTGGLVKAVGFLLWVGIALAIIAGIVFLVRYLGSRTTAP